MLHIYARGVYRIHLKIALPTPALSGSGSLGMISAQTGTPRKIFNFTLFLLY